MIWYLDSTPVQKNQECAVPLGVQGDNQTLRYTADVSDWLALWPSGVVALVLQAPDRSEPYMANTSIDRETGIVTWTVTAFDTSIVGYGYGELRIVENDVIKKSYRFATYIRPSILATAAEPPAPYPDWITELLEAASDTQANVVAAQAAQTAAEAAQSAAEESAGTAATFAEAAAASATSAASSKEAAASSAVGAHVSETRAANFANYARGYSTEAHTSAIQAAGSATDAAGSATQAAGSVTAAETAQASAETAQAAAEAAQAAAETAQGKAEDAQAAAEAAASSAISDIQTQQQTSVAAVQSAGQTQITNIESKGAQTIASIPADYTTLSGDVSNLKSAFVRGQENVLPYMVVNDEYVTTSGVITPYTGWDRTDYIPLANVYSITVSATQASGYNAFYKADKTFRAQIAVGTTPTTIVPPSDAAYAIFSFSHNVMATFSPTFVSKTDHQIEINKSLALSGIGTVLSSTDQLVAPYNDCNTLVNNTTVTILANPIGTMAHIPTGFNGGTILTFDAQANGTIEAAQIAIRKDGQIFTRHNYGGWSDWIGYAHSGLSLEGSGKLFSTSADFAAPYDDCDTFPNNSTITIIANAASLVDNLPSDFAQGTIVTLDATANDTIAKAQIAIRKNGTISTRHKWGDDWSDWYTPPTAPETLADFSMFPDFAVLGDSFASGTILTQQGSIWGMYPDYSWPEILSRMTGSEVANYSTSGLSTRTWLTDSDGLTAMLADTPKALYLMCLGINDGAIYNEDSSYLGSVADMKSDYTQNPDTFYGNYGRIIGNIKAHSPNARIILIANPTYDTTSATWQLFQSAMAEIAEEAGIPYVAGHADPYFDSSFYQNGQATAHPIAITYSGMAKAYKRQVELAMQNNTEYFWDVH